MVGYEDGCGSGGSCSSWHALTPYVEWWCVQWEGVDDFSVKLLSYLRSYNTSVTLHHLHHQHTSLKLKFPPPSWQTFLTQTVFINVLAAD